MHEHYLLVPSWTGPAGRSCNHDGTIIPEMSDTLWSSDKTTGWTAEGPATGFVAVDHHSAECVGIHASRQGTRFKALEPLRQAVREHFSGFAQEIASSLAVRRDPGSQYMLAASRMR
jgi:hypothetical protein